MAGLVLGSTVDRWTGVPMWGFIWLWMPIAALLTIRARRKQMGFALRIGGSVVRKLLGGRHSGFSVHNEMRIGSQDSNYG